MTRTTALALAAGALLVGCPLPQPVPEYAAGAITPPRIVVDDSIAANRITYPGTVVPVPAGCATKPPEFLLDAQLRDSNTSESIEVRWFVNYDPSNAERSYWRSQETVPSIAPNETLRNITGWTFKPYDYDGVSFDPGNAVGALHVVELVVSNAFYTGAGEPTPNRSPAANFEVQVYRWVFLNVAPSATCAPEATLCATCPP